MGVIAARPLVAGAASGDALVLDEPLSLWGGLDPGTGTIIEPRHPQYRQSAAGRVLVMQAGRGSSSSSSVLAEAIRLGTAPAAIVLGEPDAILVVGSLVGAELYDRPLPIVVVGTAGRAAIRTGDRVDVHGGGLTVRPRP